MTPTTSEARMADLKERVLQFSLLQLPGQPMMMHMGTSYLVNDLWRELQARERELVQARQIIETAMPDATKAKHAFLQETE